MRNLFLFFLITLLTGSPVIALLVIAAIYLALDYQFIGVSRWLYRGVRRGVAIRALIRGLELNPHDAAARTDLGRLLVEARRYREAVAHLERAFERMADTDETAYYLGLARLWTGSVADGEALLLQVLGRSPKFRYGEPYLRWGEYLLAAGRVPEAAERLEQFCAIFSSSVEGHYLLGVAYARADERAQAEKAFRGALEMFRRSPGYKRRDERWWAWRARLRLLTA